MNGIHRQKSVFETETVLAVLTIPKNGLSNVIRSLWNNHKYCYKKTYEIPRPSVKNFQLLTIRRD